MSGSRYRSFLESSTIQGANASYIEAYYEQFLEDPDSVDDQWRAYFRSLAQGLGGVPELTAVFVAAGAGLRMFWSWVEPGDRSRASHFAREARASMTLALGLIVVLLVSGLIEGFVTPSNLPTWARIAIGVVAELLFFIYVWTLGRSAVARGVTGDVTGADATAEAPARG